MSRWDLRAARRSARAGPAVIRRPAPLLPDFRQALEETLAALGIRPQIRKGDTHSHGLLWRWFAFEATWLAALNVVAAILLFAAAMTMTAPGMAFALWLGIAPMIYAVLNDGLPWLAFGLFVMAALKAAHARLDVKAHPATRVLGHALAAAMALGGLWVFIMLGYARIIPWLLQPVLWLAGGETSARLAAFDAALVRYFEPGLIGLCGLLLLAKQSKTGMTARAPTLRKRIALGGIAVSAFVLAIAAHAGWRHYSGADAHDALRFAIGGETLSGRDTTYGSLFAPGVQCHVSSLYGWRDDPLEPGRSEKHQGVDLAVKDGTPVRAMADGRVLFAAFDGGLGNFVALQATGRDAPVIVNGHMRRLDVRDGQMVQRGDVLGFAGSTGRSTGPHVHLQLCPAGHLHKGGFVCGGASDPYENWPTLAALARMSCSDGPSVF
ncbi:MAG: M23 family metallopeptidase [Rhizomicrobium sp.]